jgi:antitoxin Phd
VASSVWQVQEAKAHFSEVVEAATRGKPQRVTRHGKQAAVVLSAEAFDRLTRQASGGGENFVEHLLAMPRTKKRSANSNFAIPPASIKPRDIEF